MNFINSISEIDNSKIHLTKCCFIITFNIQTTMMSLKIIDLVATDRYYSSRTVSARVAQPCETKLLTQSFDTN